MGAITDNKYDAYNWIKKVINSCKTYFHFRAVDNLISNFRDRYDDWELAGNLRNYAYHREFK
jgi:hypothetical protein